jgi:hypothetical protein
MIRLRSPLLLALLLVLASTAGCSSAYFAALEKIGIPKRKLFVSRIEAAKESQEKAKEEFVSASERFRQLVKFKGGELEGKYHALSKELGKAESRAADVTKRIDAVEEVSTALFNEWKDELRQ